MTATQTRQLPERDSCPSVPAAHLFFDLLYYIIWHGPCAKEACRATNCMHAPIHPCTYTCMKLMKHEAMLRKTCVLHSHIGVCTFFLALMSTEAGGDTAEINIPFNVCLSKSWEKMRVLRARQPAQLRIQDLTYFHPILTSGFRQHACTCVNNAEKTMKTRFLRSQISQITTFSDLKKRRKKFGGDAECERVRVRGRNIATRVSRVGH